MDKIAAGLEADGILTGAGKPRWHTITINKILRNEKYIGDALLQKTYTTDFLNKTRVKNTGIVPQYYVEGNHEAIIPKDIYMRIQEELVRRRVIKTSTNKGWSTAVIQYSAVEIIPVLLSMMTEESYSYNPCILYLIIRILLRENSLNVLPFTLFCGNI